MNFFKKRKELKEEIEKYAFTENGKPDYNYYVMTKNEKILYTIIGVMIFVVLSFTFYRNIILCIILGVAGIFFPDYMYSRIIKKRKANLNLQFKDLMYSISASLSAGKSVERAFIEAPNDMKLLYPDENTDILRELNYIINGLGMNENIETLIYDLAVRSHNEDIENFADVFISCKRTGGNLVEVVRMTSGIISDKIEIKREIALGLSEKKFEQKGMCALMILLVLGLTYLSGDYMDPMFTGFGGRAAMTVALIFFLISYVVGEKITNIEV